MARKASQKRRRSKASISPPPSLWTGLWSGRSRAQKNAAIFTVLAGAFLLSIQVSGVIQGISRERIGEFPHVNLEEFRDTQDGTAGLQLDGKIREIQQAEEIIIRMRAKKDKAGKLDDFEQHILDKAIRELETLRFDKKEIIDTEKPLKRK